MNYYICFIYIGIESTPHYKMLTIPQVNLLQNSSLIDEVGIVLHSDLLNKNIKQEKA